MSADFCRNVAEAGRYADGNGLYLHVDPSGARRWVQRLVIHGRSRGLGLGSYALVSFAQARRKPSPTASSHAGAATPGHPGRPRLRPRRSLVPDGNGGAPAFGGGVAVRPGSEPRLLDADATDSGRERPWQPAVSESGTGSSRPAKRFSRRSGRSSRRAWTT
ncbi:MAG: Arm DNA-binding domain-containing protein, partial [Acidobacteria bacterium]|nr:Arm DNA-binding domain-containing protein [Acidobacteriota bacterium]